MIKQSIKFGLNVIFDKNIYTAIDFASKNNFSSIELWAAAPQFLPKNSSRKQLAKTVEYAVSKNVQIQFHAPEYMSFFVAEPDISKAFFHRYKTLVDFAHNFKATTFTVHPGSITTFSFPKGKKVFLHNSYPKHFLNAFQKNIEKLCNYARNKINICIENADRFDKPLMELVDKILLNKRLFLTWDIAKSYNKIDGSIKKQQVNFFLKNIKYIKNVHIHDATLLGSHDIIGKGFVDFKFFFNKLKNLDVNYIIEVRPHSNALKSRDNLLRILR